MRNEARIILELISEYILLFNVNYQITRLTTCIKANGSLYYWNTGASKSFYGDTDLSTRICTFEYTITLRILSNDMSYYYLIKDKGNLCNAGKWGHAKAYMNTGIS